ncbi:pyroglutamyl-peptidase I [Curtobacterium sp. 'Ferrero']|uniref:pyroglutamyl-peptidase I n=1 Tax=Curtobacterium sp. 'Ferrero' TaxID=2033654 RepID=UPI000BC64DF2|nr:pyroglutamyl-peptidase I [Curtobacterium sp. 'Ferrero']PCN47735.1 pyroglutamyl-peptidase I [Curtobacterium sp. 'Ferrero']
MADATEPTVLLTAFEPFGGAAGNPSWDAASALAASWDGPARLVVERLPVVFAEVRQRLAAAILEHRPAVVVATGLAEGRAAVTPERVAINVRDARIPDNAGEQPVDEPIDPHGPAAYFSGLPIKRIVAGLRAAGVPAAVSNTAGTFTCNQVFYELMSLAGRDGLRAGFVHVPATPGFGTADLPVVPLDDLVRALDVVVRESLDPRPDLVESGGAEH